MLERLTFHQLISKSLPSSEVMGLKYRLFEQVSPGYTFDAIAIALLSRASVLGVVLTSLFFGALRSSANVMQRSAGVPATIVYAIQGLTVLFIAISLVIERQVGSPTSQVTIRVSANHQ